VGVANGSNEAILGQTTATLKLGPSLKQKTTLMILPTGITDVDIILSADWINENRATLCWNTHRMTVRKGGAKFVLLPKYETEEVDDWNTAPDGSKVLQYVTTAIRRIHTDTPHRHAS
jgi:hypothetical protein